MGAMYSEKISSKYGTTFSCYNAKLYIPIKYLLRFVDKETLLILWRLWSNNLTSFDSAGTRIDELECISMSTSIYNVKYMHSTNEFSSLNVI